ncbi:MAG: ATP-dependent helicase HrpB [Hyphomicrobium sp.]
MTAAGNTASSNLPIEDVLVELRAALRTQSSAILVAPPGAGKTTRVPLALLDEPWVKSGKILILEPRRLAARGAADRMAKTLGQQIGETVGLRARLSTKTGSKTRIEVITEGVFTRMILDDPGLSGVAAVLFDEFHERSLDADLGLALALDSQRSIREDLRLLVMSATLDGARVAGLLGNAPVIESQGRAFEVVTRYLGRNSSNRIEDEMTDAIIRALRVDTGSVLAFLPGQGEIRRVEERLAERITEPTTILAPLYGAMDMAAQDRAVSPAPPSCRKVVLATSIAESSLTIEGVRIVVDCGLARVPRFEPGVGVTRLETVRVSRASADQRRGRAGRTESGICYRLWDEPQTAALPAFAEPEIRSADLSGLTLDCAEWGVTDPASLLFLDPPPAAALAAAKEALVALHALDGVGRITAQGRSMRALPLPPRLARMVLAAAAMGDEREAANVAAILVERGLGGNDTDLSHRLSNFRSDRSRRAEDMRRVASGWAKSAASAVGRDAGRVKAASTNPYVTSPAALLALAFPDRLAKARGAPGQFLLANGRGANLDAVNDLARSPFLVVADLQGAAAATRILLAAACDEPEIIEIAGDRIQQADEVFFDSAAAALRARRVRRLDALALSSEPRSVEANEQTAIALAQGIAGLGISRLPWTNAQLQLRDRLAFLKAAGGNGWPDVSDAALTATIETWLVPFLTGKTKLAEIGAEDLGQAIDALIPWSLKRRIDEEAPTHFEAPTGNRHAIDYEGAGAPALTIRVQELFGLKQHPSIANGRLALTLNLTSPAHRPIQITRDLPGFWAGSWSAVKAEMRGKYPRHPWPDDPANAVPTARAKPRGT